MYVCVHTFKTVTRGSVIMDSVGYSGAGVLQAVRCCVVSFTDDLRDLFWERVTINVQSTVRTITYIWIGTLENVYVCVCVCVCV